MFTDDEILAALEALKKPDAYGKLDSISKIEDFNDIFDSHAKNDSVRAYCQLFEKMLLLVSKWIDDVKGKHIRLKNGQSITLFPRLSFETISRCNRSIENKEELVLELVTDLMTRRFAVFKRDKAVVCDCRIKGTIASSFIMFMKNGLYYSLRSRLSKAVRSSTKNILDLTEVIEREEVRSQYEDKKLQSNESEELLTLVSAMFKANHAKGKTLEVFTIREKILTNKLQMEEEYRFLDGKGINEEKAIKRYICKKLGISGGYYDTIMTRIGQTLSPLVEESRSLLSNMTLDECLNRIEVRKQKGCNDEKQG